MVTPLLTGVTLQVTPLVRGWPLDPIAVAFALAPAVPSSVTDARLNVTLARVKTVEGVLLVTVKKAERVSVPRMA